MKLALNALSGEPEQPDVPNASCCVDEIHVRDGKTYTTITDDRADEPRGRPHVGVAFPGAASSAMPFQLSRRNMRAGARPWFGAALVQRYVAIVDPLLVRPLRAEAFLAGERRCVDRRGWCDLIRLSVLGRCRHRQADREQ